MWTPQQKCVIDAPVSDILVTAAAGSGKTAVMVERILSRVTGEHPVDIDRILVVTYTNAAAGEIRERITMKLLELIDEGAESLKNQLVLVSRASICTIHSFCLEVIRSNFHLLGLDPNFRIGDGLEVELLKAQALDEVFDEQYEAEDTVFLELVNCYTKKTDERLVGMVRAVHEFSRSQPDPDRWLLEVECSYADGCGDSLAFLLHIAKESAQYAVTLYDRALQICAAGAALSGWQETLAEERQLFSQFIAACDRSWDAAYSVFDGYRFAIKRRTKKAGEWEQERIKALRDEARDIYKEISQSLVCSPQAVLADDAARLHPRVKKLLSLVRRYDERYAAKKRARNLIDFSDFEHLTLDLLRDESGGPSDIARALMEKYEEIYVDEYQDCNSVQEALFSAISRRHIGMPNVFMVGDLKQSIYKFRDANPRLIKEKSDVFPQYREGAGQKQAKIVLNRNFRSRAAVLNGVNFLFSRLMSEGAGELTYGEEERLVPGAEFPPEDSPIEVDVLDAAGAGNIQGDNISNLQAEAAFVAQKIRAMVNGGCMVTDKATGQLRPARYRDIVILLRSTRGNAEAFAQALAQQDVPCYSDVGGGYFDTYEIRTLIAFLRVVSNPLDDISLAAVMRCGVYGFTDNELLTFRAEEKDGYFYDAVTAYVQRHDNALANKTQAFLDAFVSYRDAAKFMDTDEFLRYLADDTGYFAYIGTLSNPALRRANVRALFYRAQQFESGNFKGVFHFVRYVEKLKKNGSDGDSAKIIGEQDDVVRIMSIHKSKGLEFPIVFLSMCGKKFNTRDLTDPVLLHRELGLGLDYVDFEKRFSYPSAAKTAIRESLRMEGLSEELRVLYVALTRPKERLVLTGVYADAKKRLEQLAQAVAGQNQTLHPRVVFSAAGFLDWVLMALLRHSSVLEEYDTGTRIADSSLFDIHVIPKEDIAAGSHAVPRTVQTIEAGRQYSAYADEIRRRLSWRYPFAESNRLPSNVTVTELKRLLESMQEGEFRLFDSIEIRKPRFMEPGEKITGARAGTVMHFCMQKICLTGDGKRDTIEAEIQSFYEAGFLTKEELESVDAGKISAFLHSPLGRELCASPKVCREVPFKLLVDAEALFGMAKGEEIVIQGTIDAYFWDANGKLVLLDYKTDKVRGSSAKIGERYALQLRCYSYALEVLTGSPVARRCIYLFDTGETLEL